MHDAGAVEQVIKHLKDEPDAFDQGWSHDPLGVQGKAGMTRGLSSCMAVLKAMAKNNDTQRNTILKADGIRSIQAMLKRVGDLKGRVVFGGFFDVPAAACAALHALVMEQNGSGSEVGLEALKSSGVLQTVAELVRVRKTSPSQDVDNFAPDGM